MLLSNKAKKKTKGLSSQWHKMPQSRSSPCPRFALTRTTEIMGPLRCTGELGRVFFGSKFGGILRQPRLMKWCFNFLTSDDLASHFKVLTQQDFGAYMLQDRV